MKHPSWITLPALSTFFVGGSQRKPMTFSRELTNSSHVWSNFRRQLHVRTTIKFSPSVVGGCDARTLRKSFRFFPWKFYYLKHWNNITIPGVVGGTSLVTILLLLALFCNASSLGCFSNIVFIAAGVISFSCLAASFNSSLLAFRNVWNISST